VLEKDISGMWEMQQQMQRQQMPSPPEPSEEQLKDAIWIVLAMQTAQRNPMMPPQPMEPKIKEHIDAGGSALILADVNGDALSGVLSSWGVDLKTNVIAMHEPVTTTDGARQDYLEEAMKIPFIFDIRKFGDHPIVKPLTSLQALLVPLLIVQTKEVPGYKAAPLIPIPDAPDAPRSWGETDLMALEQGDTPKFDPKTDLSGPLYAAAAVEKENGPRLVVIGSSSFAFDQLLAMPDPEMAKRGIPVARFPANAELILNSVHWLAKLDTLIAISPASMEVSRIEPMSDGTLKVWRIGVLTIGLPLIVLIAGALMYLNRRD
jgi:hypothetical protein